MFGPNSNSVCSLWTEGWHNKNVFLQNIYIPSLIQMYNKSKQQSLHDALGSSKYVTHKRLRIDIGELKEIIYN